MKRSKLLLISGILSTAYLFYILNYFIGEIFSSDTVESISSGIASVLVMPHMLLVGLGFLFNWIGWALKQRWAALTSGILYAISILLMFIYAPFVIVQMILCFIAFARMKKELSIQN